MIFKHSFSILVVLAIAFVLSSVAGAAPTSVPTSINVQGRLTDSTGSPLSAEMDELSF